jgi:hypothetical protein
MEAINNTTIHETSATSEHRSGVFGPSDILSGTVAGFFDEEICRVWILGRLHPDGAACPACLSPIAGEASLQSFWSGDRVRCVRCGKYFTALTGTFLAGGHLGYTQVILIGILIGSLADDSAIASIMSMSTEGVRLWRRRFELSQLIRNYTVPGGPFFTGKRTQESRGAGKGGAGGCSIVEVPV